MSELPEELRARWLTDQGRARRRDIIASLQAGEQLVDGYPGARGRHDPDRASLLGARLVGANLGVSELVDADLAGANLEEATLGGSNGRRASFRNARLVGAGLGGGHFEAASFAGADLTGAEIAYADLSRADLTGVDLSKANAEKPLNPYTGKPYTD